MAALTAVVTATLGLVPTARAVAPYDGGAPSAGTVSPQSAGPENHHRQNDIDLDSPSDGWIVGSFYGTDSGARTLARTKHWDGTRWSLVKAANPGGMFNDLVAVDAVSPTEAWAVGFLEAGLETPWQPLIEHWDGKHWTASPSPPVYSGILRDVQEISPDDVWAVGQTEADGAATWRTFTEHWDGTSWTAIPSPNRPTDRPQPQDFNYLFSVAALSTDNVWAVGETLCCPRVALIEHWNGQRWSLMGDGSPFGTGPSKVTALSATDIWVVGGVSVGNTETPFAEHWDGQHWTQTATPDGQGTNNFFSSVSAASPTDVWAVGQQGNASDYTSKTLIEHWDGTSWNVVPSPNRTRTDEPYHLNTLTGVYAGSADDAWAIGSFSFKRLEKDKSMTQHWDGTSWQNVGPKDDR